MTLCCISLKEKEESYYSDGTCNGERYFTCPAGKGFFTLLSNCQPDSRLGMWYATNNYVVENSSCTAVFLCQFRTPVLLLMNNCNYSAHFLSKENMSDNFLSYFCFVWFFFIFAEAYRVLWVNSSGPYPPLPPQFLTSCTIVLFWIFF